MDGPDKIQRLADHSRVRGGPCETEGGPCDTLEITDIAKMPPLMLAQSYYPENKKYPHPFPGVDDVP